MRMYVAVSQRSNGVKIWSLAFTICSDLSCIVSLLLQDNMDMSGIIYYNKILVKH